MTPFRFNYSTERALGSDRGLERSLLQIYADRRISDLEAKDMLRKVADHKWFVSEKLNRDVGFHVAAIDYVENFYLPPVAVTRSTQFGASIRKIAEMARSAAVAYLTAKGRSMPI